MSICNPLIPDLLPSLDFAGGGQADTGAMAQPYQPALCDLQVVEQGDHIGRVPRLVKRGFRGPVYCTPPTVDRAEVLLLDALAQLGGETWFRLGDRDLALHAFRTAALTAGQTLTDIFLAMTHDAGPTVVSWADLLGESS